MNCTSSTKKSGKLIKTMYQIISVSLPTWVNQEDVFDTQEMVNLILDLEKEDTDCKMNAPVEKIQGKLNIN